jgi:hypothetical protein
VYAVLVFSFSSTIARLCPCINHFNSLDLPHSKLHAILWVLRKRPAYGYEIVTYIMRLIGDLLGGAFCWTSGFWADLLVGEEFPKFRVDCFLTAMGSGRFFGSGFLATGVGFFSGGLIGIIFAISSSDRLSSDGSLSLAAESSPLSSPLVISINFLFVSSSFSSSLSLIVLYRHLFSSSYSSP